MRQAQAQASYVAGFPVPPKSMLRPLRSGLVSYAASYHNFPSAKSAIRAPYAQLSPRTPSRCRFDLNQAAQPIAATRIALVRPGCQAAQESTAVRHRRDALHKDQLLALRTRPTKPRARAAAARRPDVRRVRHWQIRRAAGAGRPRQKLGERGSDERRLRRRVRGAERVRRDRRGARSSSTVSSHVLRGLT